MALSNSSMNKIASALVPEVANELMESDEWIEFLHTTIGGIIIEKMGQIDVEVLGELIMCIGDRLYLKGVSENEF